MILVCAVMLLRQPQPISPEKTYWSYLFIAPSLMVFTVFLLSRWLLSHAGFSEILSPGSSFIGLANFRKKWQGMDFL